MPIYFFKHSESSLNCGMFKLCAWKLSVFLFHRSPLQRYLKSVWPESSELIRAILTTRLSCLYKVQ